MTNDKYIDVSSKGEGRLIGKKVPCFFEYKGGLQIGNDSFKITLCDFEALLITRRKIEI
jgi:hypothetical protein